MYGYGPHWYPPQQTVPNNIDPLANINNAIAFYKALRRELQDEHKDKDKDKPKETTKIWSRIETFVILSLTMPFLYTLQFILIWKMLRP